MSETKEVISALEHITKMAKEVGFAMGDAAVGMDVLRNVFSEVTCEECKQKLVVISSKELGGSIYCGTCYTTMMPTSRNQRLNNVE